MARLPGAREKVTAADSAYSNALRAASRCEEHLELIFCLLGQSLRGVTCGGATSSRFLVALWGGLSRRSHSRPEKDYRIGFLANDPTIPTQAAGQAFLNGLRDSGFVEGKNVIIERRFAEARLDRYDDLFAELTRLQVHLIVTAADNATLAAKRSNIKIPAVMLSVTDPVGQGIVASLARPGQLQRQQLELATPSLKVSLRQFVARQVSDFATAF